MKAERRHELQHNEVADWLAATIERVKPYSRAIVAVAVAGTVLLITYVVLSGRSEKKQSVAWSDYYQALQADAKDVTTDLESVVREHDGVPAGLWAEVALADVKLGEGIDSLFRDKQAAQTKLRSAVQHYEAVLEDAEDPLLAARARFGLARAFESLGRLDEARKVYDEVVKTFGTNAYVSLAKERLADLERSSTQDFYAWFAKQEPVSVPPPSDTLPGTPGERLPFDTRSFDSPGGLNLPGGSILDVPPLDKGLSGPLLVPEKPSEKNGNESDATADKKETDQDETTKDEEKDAAKGEADKDESKGAAATDEAKEEKQDADLKPKNDANNAAAADKASDKKSVEAKDGKAVK
jgi:tetratricopeptide (TPR) repeat protein